MEEAGREDQTALRVPSEGRCPLAFAGVWEHWKAPDGALEWDIFFILTTFANSLTTTVHDRMPVILKPSDYDRWLDTADIECPPVDLLRHYNAERWRRML